MARRSFRLVKDIDTHYDSTRRSSNNEDEVEVKWTDCIICQDKSKKKLVCPTNNKHNADLQHQYSKLMQDVQRFQTV